MSEQIENEYFSDFHKIIEAEANISAKLVPLLGDENRLAQVHGRTKTELIKESKEFRSKVKEDYNDVRSKFRKIMNKVRYEELDTFDKLRAQTASGHTDDPYMEMLEEIRRIDQAEKNKRVRFGFSSRSQTGDSDEEAIDVQNEGKENESMVEVNGKVYPMLSSQSAKKKVTRGNSFSKKENSKEKIVPFRSSAGFSKSKMNGDLNVQVKSKKKLMRAESAKRNKLPPSSITKEKLNELKELKMNEEKDKIMSEFNKIVSRTSTNFKEPKFPNSTRKKVLEPISSGIDLEAMGLPLKNIAKYSKPSMLSAQNEAIREMLRTKTSES